MIFVSVGTHEQPMDRLFRELESLISKGHITGPVEVQYGFSDFHFNHCKARELILIQEIDRLMREADLVICHGGPATIMQARVWNKVPIVVPRQQEFGEHINDHQVAFCRRLASLGLIIPVYDIECLGEVVLNYQQHRANLAGTENFGAVGASRSDLCRRLTEYCRSLKSTS